MSHAHPAPPRCRPPPQSRVRSTYLKTWFVPDVVASIPYDLIALLAKQGDLAAYLRLLRLVRMVRLPRLFK